ncbi:riboflavin kinase/FMN adenylyltransferase [Amycolatopsis lexingtonensis]|uniref:riboflavin kinase n=1 Tax=Amycolatopsis lexingtonensis TaxID=218822 RepID=A0ABR9I1P2_9PSEU|nr:riboflavin kinase [Amycolatopsis lexingtonensis]MBE1497078.1 riboflavin kinase/FMN adenylyltransferase [Amycolatopsis lexingtonensis]
MPEYFVVRGTVESGDKRGRELGFPTANIALSDQDGSLGDGVWAGWAGRPDGTRIPAAISVGRRPTYYGADGYRLLEAHLLDFSGDLYGETLVVWLGSHLRDQEKYSSAEDLITALKNDIATATQWTLAHPAASLPEPGESPLGEVRRLTT